MRRYVFLCFVFFLNFSVYGNRLPAFAAKKVAKTVTKNVMGKGTEGIVASPLAAARSASNVVDYRQIYQELVERDQPVEEASVDNAAQQVIEDTQEIVEELETTDEELETANVDKEESTAETVDLFEAARSGDHDGVTKALEGGQDIDADDGYGNTALMLASSAGNLELVKLLVNLGANINQRDALSKIALQRADDQAVKDFLTTERDKGCSYYELAKKRRKEDERKRRQEGRSRRSKRDCSRNR